MPLILVTNTNTGRAAWGSGAQAAETFTFRPNATTGGGVYGTWAELYTDYAIATAARPNTQKQIVFDNALLPAGDPVVIEAVAGVAQQTFESRTTFTSADNPGNRIAVEVDNDVEWNIDEDPAESISKFTSFGLDIRRRNGVNANAWLSAATDPDSFEIELNDSSLSNASAAAAVYQTGTGGAVATRPIISLRDSELVAETGAIVDIRSPVLPGMNLSARGQSEIQRNTIESALEVPEVISTLDAETQLDGQDYLDIIPGAELNGPAASANVRPSRAMTVITADQLATAGVSSRPIIKQAFLLGLTALPNDGDSVSITDGTVTEAYVYRNAPAAGEVQIGATANETLVNLAAVITSDSALWSGSFVRNDQTGRAAVAVIRVSQAKERYADRAFGTDTAAVAKLGSLTEAGYIPLNYSDIEIIDLPAADAGYGVAGFSSIIALPDGTPVNVLDGRTSGLYQAINAVGGGGSGEWQLIAVPNDPVIFKTTAGATTINRGTRLVVATLAGGIAANMGLVDEYPVGQLLSVRRTDADGASSLVLTPESGTINGGANLPVVVTSGVTVIFDGTNWHSV